MFSKKKEKEEEEERDGRGGIISITSISCSTQPGKGFGRKA